MALLAWGRGADAFPHQRGSRAGIYPTSFRCACGHTVLSSVFWFQQYLWGLRLKSGATGAPALSVSQLAVDTAGIVSHLWRERASFLQLASRAPLRLSGLPCSTRAASSGSPGPRPAAGLFSLPEASVRVYCIGF